MDLNKIHFELVHDFFFSFVVQKKLIVTRPPWNWEWQNAITIQKGSMWGPVGLASVYQYTLLESSEACETETPDWLFLCLVCGFVLLSISLSFSVVVWTSLTRVLWSHLWPPSLCLISCFWGNSHIILMWSQTIFLSGVLGIYESVLCLKLLFFKWISVKINQNPNIWAMTFYSSA